MEIQRGAGGVGGFINQVGVVYGGLGLFLAMGRGEGLGLGRGDSGEDKGEPGVMAC
jgi:hypothetical protein